jgi:hypothetical protein
MFNALNGVGGGGNVDRGSSLLFNLSLKALMSRSAVTIATRANMAMMASSAISYLFLCVPLLEILGVRTIRLGSES